MSGAEATLVPSSESRPPTLRKAVAPLRHPAEVMVLLDTDVLVVRHLADFVGTARGGKVVGFPDVLHADRHFAEWETLFGVGPPRRQPYMNAGHLLVPYERRALLEEFDVLQDGLDVERTLLGSGKFEEPLFFADMDVLNALLATRVPADELAIVDRAVAYAPFDGVHVADETTLECELDDGAQPYLLHHIYEKPWLARTAPNAYTQLLLRLLFRDDVAIRLTPEQVPPQLRPGAWGATLRHAAGVRRSLHEHLRGRVGVRRRIRERRQARLEAGSR